MTTVLQRETDHAGSRHLRPGGGMGCKLDLNRLIRIISGSIQGVISWIERRERLALASLWDTRLHWMQRVFA